MIAGFSVAFAIFPTKPMIARYLLLFCYSKILRKQNKFAIFAVEATNGKGMAKQKQTVKLKEPVRIRFKQLSNGNQSIYLEYYTGDVIRKENYVGGKRKYEFLKLYLIPERTREDKAKNEATLALAKAIQSRRIVEVQNDAHGFQNTNKSRVNLLDYLENIGKQSDEQ